MKGMVKTRGKINYALLFIIISSIVCILIALVINYTLAHIEMSSVFGFWFFLFILVAFAFLMIDSSHELWIPSEGDVAERVLIRKYFRSMKGKPYSYLSSDIDWHIFVLDGGKMQYGIRIIQPDEKTLFYLQSLEKAKEENIKHLLRTIRL